MKTAILHNFDETINAIQEHLTASRETSIAITKLQEAGFWIEQAREKKDFKESISEAM